MDKTRDLSKFGVSELATACMLLTLYAAKCWESTDDLLYYDVAIELDQDSRKVFLVDSYQHCTAINGSGNLESWVNCEDCGMGGFRRTLKLDGYGHCVACANK